MIAADQPQFRLWLSENAELRGLIDDRRIPTDEDQMKWFKRVQEPDRKFFSLVTVPNGELIGNCGFVEIDAAKKSAILRITIGNPAFLGQGLGSEAVELMTRFGFEQAGWQHIALHVLKTNARAVRSYEKAGFVPCSEEEKDGKTLLMMTLDRPNVSHETPRRGTLPCSVIMYIRNSGPLFERCLQSALPCREHVVLDGGSRDGSADLARKYGCRVLPQDPKFLDPTGRILDFGGIATQAYEESTEPWITFLAADEELNDDFIAAMQRVIERGEKGAYLVDRYFIINGRVMKYFSTKHNRQIRFCDRASVLGFTKAVHERPVLASGVVPKVLEGGAQYLPTLETPAELKEKYRRYLDLDKGRIESFGWIGWIGFASRRFAIMAMLIARVLWIRVIHDSQDCMPLGYEWLNVWYGWEAIKRSCPLARRS